MSLTDIFGLLQLPPVQRAVLALAIAGAAFPIAGVWIIGLNIVPVRFAMMHVTLLGIALGILLGIEPALSGLALCALTGIALAPLAQRPAGLGGPMGLVMTLAIALALLVLSVSGVNANGAFELLWGSILATRSSDVLLLSGIAATITGLHVWQRRELALLLYDREIALVSGIDVTRLNLLLMLVIAIAIAAAVRLTGALLVDAVTILPALAARNLGRSLSSMVAWAVVLGFVGNMLGFALTLLLNQPPGPLLVLTVGMITLITYIKGGIS
ncbi:MAG: metal ABC transporter permease [Kouleothrix sp.]